jgi:protein-tyrosine kinase
MKLRKALDKAKKARQEETPTTSSGSPALEVVKVERAESISPVYSESRSIGLNPKKASENRCVCILPDAPEIDSYKVIRTQIQQRARENGWNTVMVTSVQPGEGKTLTSINLAITFAKEFHQTVLLVDCDLKQQNIHQYLGLSSDTGLIDYLTDDCPLKDLIIWPGIEKLTLISGGKTIQDSTELLGSPRMKSLISEMKSRYEDRFVFFDVPPILGRADAIAFAPLVDCILMVVEAGQTSIQDIKKALELIPKDKFMGFVLNRS